MTDSDLTESLAALSADEADEQTYKLLSATHDAEGAKPIRAPREQVKDGR